MNDDIDLNDLFHEDEPEKESAPTKICHEKDCGHRMRAVVGDRKDSCCNAECPHFEKLKNVSYSRMRPLGGKRE